MTNKEKKCDRKYRPATINAIAAANECTHVTSATRFSTAINRFVPSSSADSVRLTRGSGGGALEKHTDTARFRFESLSFARLTRFLTVIRCCRSPCHSERRLC